VPITVVSKSDHDMVLQIEAIDYPRLIEITEKATTGAPTIAISAPQDGATLAGKVPVNLKASADTTSIQLQLDGVTLGQPLTAPFKYTWDTSGVPNGTRSHVLSAVATNAAGISSTASVTVTIVNPDIFPPTAPNDLTSNSKTGTSIELAWTNPNDNQGGSGVAGYHLYRDGKMIASPAASHTPRTFYTDTKLTPNTTYVYTITAYDNAGNVSPLSTPVSLTTKLH
jgi:chitinase